MQNLSDNGFITNLEEVNKITGGYLWTFTMGSLTFQYEGKTTDVDFTKYQLKIIYKKKYPPKVYLIEPPITTKTKHVWEDGRLCLYKPSIFQWEDNMQIDRDLFPTICTWLYHFTVWKATGKWLGEEAEH